MIKDKDGNASTGVESVEARMSKDNERRRAEIMIGVDQEVAKIVKAEVRRALKRMEMGKAV